MTTQIDKQTITIGKAMLIIISISQALITYMASSYGTKAAIKELEYKTNMEIQELRYEDKLLWNRVNTLAVNTCRHEALKPDEVKPKEEEEN